MTRYRSATVADLHGLPRTKIKLKNSISNSVCGRLSQCALPDVFPERSHIRLGLKFYYARFTETVGDGHEPFSREWLKVGVLP